MAQLRTDIQALRGVAILIVVIFHARIGPFQSGFLGVDMFFVISGYLITRLICAGVEADRFSFLDFYFRRVRRLFPAAFVVFLACALAAPELLTGVEYTAFKAQLLGAMTLTGNVVLWKQSGYFDGAAEYKPLLHVWSLAIEEQYYLLAPALLVFTPRRYWLRGAIAICALSLAACLLIAPFRAAAVFYLLPTRAWELAIGSIGALCSRDHSRKPSSPHPRPPPQGGRAIVPRLFWPAMAAIALLPLTPPLGPQPGFAALAICLATLIVILRESPIFIDARIWAPLVRLGDISYSLYLVHWPIFAFLRNAWIGDVPISIRAMAAFASIALALLLYRYVETPFRKIEIRLKAATIVAAVAASLALSAAPFAIASGGAAQTDFEALRRINYGFDKACEFEADFEPKTECRDSDAPTMLVWGDSYAMHLVPGLAAAEPKIGIVQATRSFCAPTRGMAPFAKPGQNQTAQGYDREWAKSCIAFNESVLDHVKATASIRYVVLATRLTQALAAQTVDMLRKTPEGFVAETPTVDGAIDGFRRTILALREMGKRVVYVASPPVAGFDLGVCMERRRTGKPALGPFASCDMPLAAYKRWSAPLDDVLHRLSAETDIDIVNFDAALCVEGLCRAEVDGVMIYRDDGHFSYDGSRAAIRASGLAEQIRTRAR